jgi:hypothetical protein
MVLRDYLVIECTRLAAETALSTYIRTGPSFLEPGLLWANSPHRHSGNSRHAAYYWGDEMMVSLSGRASQKADRTKQRERI